VLMKSRTITAQELFFTYTSDRFIQRIYYIIHLWSPRLHSPSLGQHSQRDEWCKMTVSCLSLPSSNPAGLTSHLNQWLSINQAHHDIRQIRRYIYIFCVSTRWYERSIPLLQDPCQGLLSNRIKQVLEFGMGCCYENLHELQAVIP